MKEVPQAPRRSTAFTPQALTEKLGKVKLKDITRERVIQFGKERAREGAGPVTICMDIGYLELVISHALPYMVSLPESSQSTWRELH